ncbi:MAG: hypothetical protein SW833_25395 [Cyanobacteriota bacterium]|nr:hypothetical protein [Cyanobacteriota bacterium]
MSFTEEGLKQHCETILKSRRIKNKIVILCEGERPPIDPNTILSPQLYRKMEEMPDANFYRACLPQWWTQYQPRFFNCGDRMDVLDTYSMLLALHQQAPTNSYLSPEKLFAIVDLDIQIYNISDYHFTDTETVFYDLYQHGKVNSKTAKQHRIWVTGLVHKESYFLIPELQTTFDKCSTPPMYNSSLLLLDRVYRDMAKQMEIDPDLKNFFETATRRIDYCSGLDCSGINCLQNSWEDCFDTAANETRKNELIFALLTIEKAKEFWKQVKPPSGWTGSIRAFKDQLLLEIGRFYSDKGDNPRYHIAFFLKTLYDSIGV